MTLEKIASHSIISRVYLTGSIENVISAAIAPENTFPRTPAMTGYSFGLGACGPNYTAVKSSFGEFCSTPVCAGYLTAGEQNLTYSHIGTDTRFYTPFNVSLGFDFHEFYRFASDIALTFAGLYQLFLEKARSNHLFKGLLAVSGIFQIESFFGSLIKTAPLQGTLSQGKLIDPGRFHHWFGVDTAPVYSDCRAVSVGLGLDLNHNSFPENRLNRIFYLHPGNKNTSDKMLHNHCFILPPGDLPVKITSYHAAAFGLLSNNQILDIKHILDNTAVKSGYFALGYIQEIVDL